MTRFNVRKPLCPLNRAAAQLALGSALLGTALSSIAGAQVYTQGLPTVGNPGSSNAAASQMSIDATQFGGSDMCAKIAAACAKLGASMPDYPKGATIDARGFTGTQVCSGSLTTTTMLNACVTGTNHNGGKLLLGNVNLYIDGPTSGNYTDGTSGIGTPAIIIPSFFWGIEGISRGASANGSSAGLGTFISPCPSTNPPTGCSHPFPVRSFPITQTSVSGNSMVITLSGTVTSGATVYPGELAMVKGNTGAVSNNGTYKIQSITNSSSSPPILGSVTVTVPSGTANCGSNCGTLYLGTPILGFGGSNTYNNSACLGAGGSLCSGFGEHIKNLGFNCQALDGCIGWQNLYAEEESGADTFLITQLNFVGVDIHNPSLGTQNFGPVLNAEIYTGPGNAACDYGTTGIYIGDAQMRGLNAWTIVQSNQAPNPAVQVCGPPPGHNPLAAVLFDAPNTEVVNGHCEGFNNCVLMGANNAPNTTLGTLGASGEKVSTVAGATCNVTTCDVVHISNNYPNNTDYVIQNIRRKSNFTNTIVDDVNGVTIGNDLFTGFYSWGNNLNNSPPPSSTLTNLVTTDTSTVNQFGSGVLSSTYGTTANCASTTGSCGSAAAGAVTIASGSATTVTVSSSAVTSASDIKVQYDESVGGRFSGGVTCSTATGTETASYWVSAKSAGSFTIKTNSGSRTNPICLTYMVVN
jgi:hypothetical protein